MARIDLDHGAWFEYDDKLFHSYPVSILPTAPGAELGRSTRRGSPRGLFDAALSGRPIPIRAPEDIPRGEGGLAYELARRLVNLKRVHSIGPAVGIVPGPKAPTSHMRAAPKPRTPSRLVVPLDPGMTAVALVEADGVLAWRLGKEQVLSRPATRSRVAQSPPARQVVFDLEVPAISAPAGPMPTRGWLTDRLLGAAKAVVLYFAAEATAKAAVAALERNRRNGPVVIRSAEHLDEWEFPADLKSIQLPVDRDARVLLLVHGTFSSTVGGFGELTVTPWGSAFLKNAIAKYDLVLGLDHRTLSLAPETNGQALLTALQSLPGSPTLRVDAVCHSRGGLVLRHFIEEILPTQNLPIQFERAVFIAATNRGTELARPENWETLLDLMTNLSTVATSVLSLFPAAAGVAAIADEVIDSIADFVKYLVQIAAKKKKVAPGLQAMNPGSELITRLNKKQEEQPRPSELACYAIVSDFQPELGVDGGHEPNEMPARLALILANGAVDRLMSANTGGPVANDLVVDVASMTAIDRPDEGYVREVLDYGRNPFVYHTNYLSRPETLLKLHRWLEVDVPLAPAKAAVIAQGISTGLVRVPESATLAEARGLASTEGLNYLLFEREHAFAAPRRLLHYAVTGNEFIRATQGGDDRQPAHLAMGLNEEDRSQPSDAPDSGRRQADAGKPYVSRGTPAPMHAMRGVVLDGDDVLSVLDAANYSPNLVQLALASQPRIAGAVPRTPGDESTRHRSPAKRAAAPPARKRPDPGEPELPKVNVLAEMPKVTQKGQLAALSLTLSLEDIVAAATAASAGGKADLPSQGVTVQVLARQGWALIKGKKYQRRAPRPSPGSAVALVFDLLAEEVGPAEVTVYLFNGPYRLLSLNVQSKIVNAEPKKKDRLQVASVSGAAGATEEFVEYPTLDITDRRTRTGLSFTFRLRTRSQLQQFRSPSDDLAPRGYVQSTYDAIEQAWKSTKSEKRAFETRLKAIGAEMFHKLFEPSMQQALWDALSAGELDGLVVWSDDPFIPWEIVYVDDPEAPAQSRGGKFLAELGMCRCLPGAAPPRSITVRQGHVRYVIPDYPQEWALPATAAERAALKARFQATPLEPRLEPVLATLGKPGAFDLLHFACHGQANYDKSGGSALALMGEKANGRWTPAYLVSQTVDSMANLRAADGNRPMVVVNACQAGRTGEALGGIGGFAVAFLGSRPGAAKVLGKAGAFVSALWSVGDEPASEFVLSLYERLSKGERLAAAVRHARKHSRKVGEATWLAYTVYAHPDLKLRLVD